MNLFFKNMMKIQIIFKCSKFPQFSLTLLCTIWLLSWMYTYPNKIFSQFLSRGVDYLKIRMILPALSPDNSMEIHRECWAANTLKQHIHLSYQRSFSKLQSCFFLLCWIKNLPLWDHPTSVPNKCHNNLWEVVLLKMRFID